MGQSACEGQMKVPAVTRPACNRRSERELHSIDADRRSDMDGSEARSASRGLGASRVDIEGKTDLAERQVRSHLDQVRRHIEQGRVKVPAGQAEIKNWAEEKKTATGDKIADWKVKRELQNRAAQAERYAAAAADGAGAGVRD